MTRYEYPNYATVLWHRFLIESVAEGFGIWRGAAHEDESSLVFVPSQLRWVRVNKWDVALDENGKSIYLFDDCSISFVIKYRFGLWPVRCRYALVPAKMPLSAHAALMAAHASIGAPSIQKMYGRSIDKTV